MADDNANYARVKRWRERHRGLANLRQREYRERKNNLSGKTGLVSDGSIRALDSRKETESGGNSPPAQSSPPFETKKVGEFRMLVMPEEVKDEPVAPVVKPKVFLNDHGAVISERVWEQLQEKKRIAKENGYEFDPQ